MKKSHLLLSAIGVLALCLANTHAGTGDIDANKVVQKEDVRIAQETNLSYSYVGGSDFKQGNAKKGDVSESNTDLKYVVSPEIRDGLLFRAGVEWERYSFGLYNDAHLPNTLQSTNLIVGFDIQLADQWLMRVDAAPGIYSDFVDLSSRDINVPIIIGASYLVNKDLQWVVGMSIDIWREFPVLPGVGVRWQFADQWVLNAILPNPRLEYQLTKTATLFVGGELKGGTYMVNGDFGRSHGEYKLNQTVLTYSEIRTGAGVSWKPIPFLTVEASGGVVPYREYDFNRADFRIHSDDVAPYAEIGISGNF